MKLLARLLCGLLLAMPLVAQAGIGPWTASQDALRQSGLDHYYNLEYDAALADFSRLAEQRLDDPASWNRVSQALLYREMYRIGALESQLYGHGDPFLQQKLLPPDPAAVSAFLAANQKAMDLATGAIAHPSAAVAPAGLAQLHYDLAVAWALRGTLEFSVNRSYLAALGDAKTARREAARARGLDPGFIDPLLILGAHNYIAGSLPWSAKLFTSVLGYRGDKTLGREQIETVAATGEHARTDADVLLAVIDRRDGLNQQAAPILAHLSAAYPRNVLFAVEWAEALEAAGDHDAARAQYRRVLDLASAHAPGFDHAPLDKVWYDLGNIERLYSLWQLAADDYQRAEQAAEGPPRQPRYLQAAALAAGEVERQAGDLAAAAEQFQRCVAVDPTSPAGVAAAHALHP